MINQKYILELLNECFHAIENYNNDVMLDQHKKTKITFLLGKIDAYTEFLESEVTNDTRNS